MQKIGIILLAAALTIMSCNKQKRKMKGLVGNWTIEQSERMVITTGGSEDVYEDISNCGDIVISDIHEDSTTVKNFTFTYIDANGDTLKVTNKLYTDDKNKRIVFKNALCDTTVGCDLIWTVDKSKKNKQIWSAYGIDNDFFYSPNNFDPNNANQWLMWRITLKRND